MITLKYYDGALVQSINPESPERALAALAKWFPPCQTIWPIRVSVYSDCSSSLLHCRLSIFTMHLYQLLSDASIDPSPPNSVQLVHGRPLAIFTAAIVFSITSTLSIVLRLISRRMKRSKLAADDYTILAAQV